MLVPKQQPPTWPPSQGGPPGGPKVVWTESEVPKLAGTRGGAQIPWLLFLSLSPLRGPRKS